MQGIYYNTEVAENDSRFMRGSKDQGSKLSISEVLARIELFYILFYIVGAQSKVCAYWANLRATRLAWLRVACLIIRNFLFDIFQVIGGVDPNARDTCWFTGISVHFGSRNDISFLLILWMKGAMILVGVWGHCISKCVSDPIGGSGWFGEWVCSAQAGHFLST